MAYYPGTQDAGDGIWSTTNSTFALGNGNVVTITNRENLLTGCRDIVYYCHPRVRLQTVVLESSDEEDSPQPERNEAETVEKLKKSFREVSVEELMDIAKNVGMGWRRLIRFLGLQDYEVEEVYKKYSSMGIEEVIFQLLRKWKQEYNCTTVSDLWSSLDRADMNRLWKYLKP